jgi:hypothetical protein
MQQAIGVIFSVEPPSKRQLFVIGHALNSLRFELPFAERRKKHRREYRDDRDDNQQFDKGESASKSALARVWPEPVKATLFTRPAQTTYQSFHTCSNSILTVRTPNTRGESRPNYQAARLAIATGCESKGRHDELNASRTIDDAASRDGSRSGDFRLSQFQ